jgi:hypothetical protein
VLHNLNVLRISVARSEHIAYVGNPKSGKDRRKLSGASLLSSVTKTHGCDGKATVIKPGDEKSDNVSYFSADELLGQ